MAYVKDGRIKSTLDKAFAYAAGHKVEDGKVCKTIASAINATVATAYQVSVALREAAEARKGRRAERTKDGQAIIGWHFQQDFAESPDELPPEAAHEIGRRLAEELFPDFPCVIGTHTNTGHIHNHIVIGAWGLDGRKHNNSNAFHQRLRETSDRLCEEHGLGVLDKTREMRLAKWLDENDEAHCWEPTERKRRLREEKGRRHSNPGDYRDTAAHERKEAARELNREAIEKGIDALIGEVSSYEQLVDRLRDAGYEVRDKKADGTWMRHVSFKAPGQARATRDCKLGDGEYYTRESLTRIIKALAAERIAKELARGRAASGEPAKAGAEKGKEGSMGMSGMGMSEAEKKRLMSGFGIAPAIEIEIDPEEAGMGRDGRPARASVWEPLRAFIDSCAEIMTRTGRALQEGEDIEKNLMIQDLLHDARESHIELKKSPDGERHQAQMTHGAWRRQRQDPRLGWKTLRLLERIDSCIRSINLIYREDIKSMDEMKATAKELGSKVKANAASAGEIARWQEYRDAIGNLQRIEREEKREEAERGKKKKGINR